MSKLNRAFKESLSALGYVVLYGALGICWALGVFWLMNTFGFFCGMLSFLVVALGAMTWMNYQRQD